MYALIVIVFILGYAAIAFENPLRINKTASALITGVLLWVLLVVAGPGIISGHGIGENHWSEFIERTIGIHFGEIAQILIFLIGAMTIVQIIDLHDGFSVVGKLIRTGNKIKLLWIIGFISFFLSAVLDNLTTSIVMVSLGSKLLKEKEDRWIFAGIIIIAANAGGAWSPIGDITTTMLWMGGQITSVGVIAQVILPSVVSLLVPLIILSWSFRKNKTLDLLMEEASESGTSQGERIFILLLGISGLLFVPVFKILFHLPPFMGMMLSLGVLWALTEIIHKSKKDGLKDKLSPTYALEKIDTSSVLFFLGILLAVSCLETTGALHDLSSWLSQKTDHPQTIVVGTGLLSAIVDNVPLVKATQGMYDLSAYPVDSSLWLFLSYCCGTGGSILIIGSAAGVAVMGMEKISFFWYLKRISLVALIGYLAGCATYLLLFPWK